MSSAPRLAARDLSFGYRRDELLFEGWDLDVHAGEVLAVTGPSGRGKSTLLYLLGLMVAPVAGQVVLDGSSVAGRGDAERARLRAQAFGFVFQDAALDPTRTVMDNVLESCLYRRQPRRAARARAEELMERLGVAVRADHRPGEISGGQAQRVALCRALLHHPAVVLADEPTGNLDPASAGVVTAALHTAAEQGAAVVVVTHDPATIARCTREVRL